jgi:hypothetical protein
MRERLARELGMLGQVAAEVAHAGRFSSSIRAITFVKSCSTMATPTVSKMFR